MRCGAKRRFVDARMGSVLDARRPAACLGCGVSGLGFKNLGLVLSVWARMGFILEARCPAACLGCGV